jgi:hypothetical protein
MREELDKPQGALTQLKNAALDLSSKVFVEKTNDRNGLNITLQFQGEPTEDTYEYLQDFFGFKLDQLKKTKKSQNNTSSN